ncbi:hypothetical protein JGE30_24200, partial [Salmonella enterica subsp. enterica serovar Give]|nr:hypothetical protein [Salmonella enterica subsp. enterica serovar Give]
MTAQTYEAALFRQLQGIPFEELDVPEQRILYFQHADLDDEQEDDEN